jgi:hypothetical protein
MIDEGVGPKVINRQINEGSHLGIGSAAFQMYDIDRIGLQLIILQDPQQGTILEFFPHLIGEQSRDAKALLGGSNRSGILIAIKARFQFDALPSLACLKLPNG